MSNTYFVMKKEVTIDDKLEPKHSYTNEYRLLLTAFVGGVNHTQLTIQTQSTLQHQSGTAYIVLGDKEVDELIAGLLERKLGKVTATGDEQSNYRFDSEE